MNEDEREFVESWGALAAHAHQIAQSKGWWEEKKNVGEMIALMHSELSEALEADRKHLYSDKIQQFSGVSEELADVVIRIMDFGQGLGFDIAGAIVEKMRYNETREYKHGGKKY